MESTKSTNAESLITIKPHELQSLYFFIGLKPNIIQTCTLGQLSNIGKCMEFSFSTGVLCNIHHPVTVKIHCTSFKKCYCPEAQCDHEKCSKNVYNLIASQIIKYIYVGSPSISKYNIFGDCLISLSRNPLTAEQLYGFSGSNSEFILDAKSTINMDPTIKIKYYPSQSLHFIIKMEPNIVQICTLEQLGKNDGYSEITFVTNALTEVNRPINVSVKCVSFVTCYCNNKVCKHTTSSNGVYNAVASQIVSYIYPHYTMGTKYNIFSDCVISFSKNHLTAEQLYQFTLPARERKLAE